MTIILILIALIYSINRGIRQGMIMIQLVDAMSNQDMFGVRGHVWFKHYHWLGISEAVLCAILGILLYLHFPNIWVSLGIFLLSWQVFESAYNYSRWKTINPSGENFLGLGIDIDTWLVDLLHILRAVLGIALIIGGMYV